MQASSIQPSFLSACLRGCHARHFLMLGGLPFMLGILAAAALFGGHQASQALPGWLPWLGAAAAGAVLLYSLALWRVMRCRADLERDLRGAREAAEQANAARGAFLSTMSHEIRTPMNAVIGMTGLLRQTQLDPQQQEFTKAVEDSASALMAIIDDILDFSRIDAGKLQVEAIAFELAAVVEGSASVLAAKAEEKGLRLVTHVAAGLPATVSGDPGRLRQVLLNLIGNAVKFTPSGEVTVRVAPVGWPRGACKVRFEVSDTGIGIDPCTAGALFMPFTQGDCSGTRKYGGTGLGLSICKRLVELMDGAIGVDRKPGGGSLFWVELTMPVVDMAGGRPHDALPAAAIAAGAPAAHSRILLVEDNVINQQVAMHQINQLGYAADIAADGQAALDALARGSYGLVLMDCQMPVMDGFEATRRIRAMRQPRDPHLWIVALTANAMPGDRERCLEAGMDGYLAKPVLPGQLAALLAQYVAPPLLDHERLRELFGDDGVLQRKMLALFIATTTPVFDELAQAIGAADCTAAAAIGHRIAGSSATLGLPQLASLGRALERAAHANDAPGLEQLHRPARIAFERLVAFVERMPAAAGRA